MKKVMIFGRNFKVVGQKAKKDFVELKNNEVIINYCKASPNILLNKFLSNLLSSYLQKTYDQIRKARKVEIFGDLNFEIVKNIDNKKQRIAKLKWNKLLIKLNVLALPKSALKYIIAHELAHVFSKRHTEKFWKTVKLIYPNFRKAQEIFEKYDNLIAQQKLKS